MKNLKKWVLCVEDHQDTCELVTRILGLEGFQVMTANSQSEGLAFHQKGQFCLVIIDINLPDGTGIELIRKIRATDAQTPIVVNSAVALNTVIEEAKEAGANAYVVKPGGWDSLVETVHQLCPRSEYAKS